MNSTQVTRLLAHFKLHPGVAISLPELHRVGSAKPTGFMASGSRRIHEVRKILAEEGGEIVLTRKTQPDGTLFTEYTYQPKA